MGFEGRAQISASVLERDDSPAAKYILDNNLAGPIKMIVVRMLQKAREEKADRNGDFKVRGKGDLPRWFNASYAELRDEGKINGSTPNIGFDDVTLYCKCAHSEELYSILQRKLGVHECEQPRVREYACSGF